MSTHIQPPRPSVMQLALKTKGDLYAAYIPWFVEGGVFVATTRDYRLGDDAYLLLSLPEEHQRYPLAGTVAWVTPAGVGGHRVQGIGVRFPADEQSAQIRAKIEQVLGSMLASDRQTLTL